MRTSARTAALAAAAGTGAIMLLSAGTASAGTLMQGSWTLQAPSSATYSAQVQQPINADGSSVFNHKSSTIPVKFQVTKSSSFTFESVNPNDPSFQTSGLGKNDYSYASWTPPAGTTVSGITDLEAVASFTQGNNGGGALRWEIDLANGKNIFVYYGTGPNFTDNLVQSGNLIANTSDVRVDTSQLAPGTQYNTWANALALAGSQPVSDAALVLDGGWSQPSLPTPISQVVNLTSATVNGDTFTMPGSVTTVDNSTPAWISITKITGATPGPVDESTLTSTQGDTGGQFRQVDGKYMYNLPVNELTDKTATYQVGVSFNSNGSSPVANTVNFGLK